MLSSSGSSLQYCHNFTLASQYQDLQHYKGIIYFAYLASEWYTIFKNYVLTKLIQKTSQWSSTFNQVELNDLVYDLALSEVDSKLFASRLKEKNALAPGTNITFFHTREKELFMYLMKIKQIMAILFPGKTFKDS